MNIKMFSIRDGAVGAFQPPFCMRSNAEAVRMFTDLCNNPEQMMNKYPEDYELWLVGDFDDNNGDMVVVKEKVITALDLVEKH